MISTTACDLANSRANRWFSARRRDRPSRPRHRWLVWHVDFGRWIGLLIMPLLLSHDNCSGLG